jgi:hypothetical protein
MDMSGTSAQPGPWPRGRIAVPSWLLAAAAGLGLAFWLYYAFLRQVAGPLYPDEIYFTHTLWLLNEGKRQYVDFYSNHLPTYFQLLKPLVAATSGGSTDLSFVWALRGLSALVIAGYVALAWALGRRLLPGIGRTGLAGVSALLLVFVVLARMVEIRADTMGLLLVNLAWAIVLCTRTARALVAAAVLAGLAVLFSARAAGMVAVMGLLMLYLAARPRDGAAVRALLSVAAAFLLAGLALYALAPEWVSLVIRSCFIEPSRLLAGSVPLHERFFGPDRLPLTVPIVAGLLAGLWMLRSARGENGLVIAVACGAQLLLVLLDPAPYQYVYGWAAVPAVLGIASVSRLFTVSYPVLLAAWIVSLSVGYTMVKGQAPPASAFFRLTFDPALTERELAALPTRDLVALLTTDEGQKNLAGQLRVRSEACRRLQGLAVATFDTHPVCLHDAMFYWTDLRWPVLLRGDRARPGTMTREEFGSGIAAARPSVVIWAHRWSAPAALLPATRQMLACCYEIHEGFALSTEALARSPVAK